MHSAHKKIILKKKLCEGYKKLTKSIYSNFRSIKTIIIIISMVQNHALCQILA